MKVYNQSASITAGSYMGGTTGYDSGLYGSISGSISIMNNDLDAIYWYQGSIYFSLDDGYTGNAGFWRIKIGNTFFYRKDATFQSGQYYSRWIWTGISTNPFTSGQSITFQVDSVRELIAELAIENASNSASYGYINESSTNLSGDVSRLYDFSHSGHHEIRKFYYYVGYGANDVYISFKKQNLPNAGWTSVCINGHYFRRTDATYSTNSYSGGMTNWSWSDIDSGILTNPTSGSQTTLVEFYSHDEEIERMREDRVVMRHHGRITPATTTSTSGPTTVKKGFRYELQQNTVNGSMPRGNFNLGVSTKRFGLTNNRLIELTYSTSHNRVELRYLVSQTVVRPEQEVDYLRINDTFFYMAEADISKSAYFGQFIMRFRWENVTSDPWESLFYVSSSNPIEFEIGKYDDTVYADCYHFIQGQNVSRSVSLDVDYQCLRILTSPSSLLSNSYNLSISGLPTGTDRYEMSGNRGVLLDFSNITYTAPFTITVQQSNRSSTVTVTNDPTEEIFAGAGIYKEKRLTHLNYISRDTSTGAATYAIESSPTLVRTLRSKNIYQWRSHVIADQNNLFEIEQKIGNYSVGSASIDSAANLNNTITQTEASNWSNNYTVDVVPDQGEGDVTIEWNHSYPTNAGGTITFDSRLEINVIGSNVKHGIAVKSPAGVKRLEAQDRMPRIHSVVTGTSTSSAGVTLSQPTGLTEDEYFCCQVHSNSAWGATIVDGQVDLIKNGHSSTTHQQFFNTNEYAVLIFKN